MAENEEKCISCEICKKEIPYSAAITSEGADYIHYFCCTDCMDYWEKSSEAEDD